MKEFNISYTTKPKVGNPETINLTVKMNDETMENAAERQARIIIGQRFDKLVNGETYTLTAKHNEADAESYLKAKNLAWANFAKQAKALFNLSNAQIEAKRADFEKAYPPFDANDSIQWILS